MFIGHFGLGFAAKKLNSRPSLGTYFMAAQFLDLVWPMLLVRGIEKVRVEPGNTAFTPLNFISSDAKFVLKLVPLIVTVVPTPVSSGA